MSQQEFDETEDEEDPGWSIDDINFYDFEVDEAEEVEDDSEIEEEDDLYDNTFDVE